MKATCPDANAIGQLVDNDLDEAARQVLLAHVDACSECRHLVALAAHSDSVPDGVDVPLRRGDRVGVYIIVRALRAGARGMVYAARDTRSNRVVALRLLRVTSEAGDVRHRLLREVGATAALSHPNVLVVYEVGSVDDYVFIAMELVEGGTLADWLATTKRPASSILDMFCQAGAGLAAAHDAGVVHHDFKPDSVLVGLDERPRVADFGLARAPARESERTRRTAALSAGLLGTRDYAAPKQQRAEPADASSDQYAFAVSLLDALGGEAFDLELGLGSAIARAKQRYGSVLSPRVWDALARALSPDRAARFPDMRSLLRALSDREPKELGAQLVDELWTRARTSLPAFLLVALLAWPLVGGPVRTSAAAAVAYGSALGLGALRWVGALFLARRPHVGSAATRYALMLAGTLANGVVVGVLNVVLCVRLEPLDLGLWIMIVAGIAGGATVSLGARPEMFLAYVIPVLGAFVVAALFWPRQGIALVPFGVVLWLVYALTQVIQYWTSRRQFIETTTELDKSLRRLGAANEALARKNVELVEMGRRADRIFSALGDALPGRTLGGRYLLEARIGSGGFAIVFRATHTELRRPVAVKIFRPQAGNDSAASLERFRHEGLANSRVRHRNIVDVIDAGLSEDGILYIAMELLEGRTLDAELNDGRSVSLVRIAEVMQQVCLGLAAAHAAGVVHRDVKPENIFLHHEQGKEVVKVLDFGIAKVADVDRLGRGAFTSTGEIIGSPRYMAPERLLGRECDASADVYSAGVVLFKALAGRFPFEGTLGEALKRALSGPPDDIRTLVPGLPEELAEFIMRALADEPQARPTAAALAGALARLSA